MLLAPAAAAAGSVTVRNGTSEVLAGIHMAPAGAASPGANRMNAHLPPGAEARIAYSTGCRADVRLAFISGRTEDHRDIDVCTDSRITAGQSGVSGPAIAAGRAPRNKATTPVVAKALPAVPPWTGRSITRRFGGMD